MWGNLDKSCRENPYKPCGGPWYYENSTDIHCFIAVHNPESC